MDNKHRFIFWSVVLVAAVSLLPFLGMTDFTTKGEPREAVVALSMLRQHNWILPVNNGIDIPYKPPFFHWCIAAFSLPAGHVTEFTARLPSAVALIIMLAMGAVFFAKRKNQDLSFLAAMLTLTCFEMNRAATNCRVDMVLTMFIVCALYALYRWWESGCRQLPWLGILCMSGATLTKGPVGIVLPCFVMAVFICVTRFLYNKKADFYNEKAENGSLCNQHLPLRGALAGLFISAILACVIPSLWYIAAYQQGGKEFLDLVMDENVGRFLGKMKFVTHANPWPYNILMLVSGWLPWTLPVLLSLIVLPWKQFSKAKFVQSCRNAKPVQVFTWLSFLLILFFYCIPKSKRGVYLLPCYPFMAILMAEYAAWLVRRSSMPIRFYIGFLTVVCFAVTILLIVIRTGAIPDSIFHGRHAYESIAMLHALAYDSLGVGDIFFILLLLCAACLGMMILFHRRVGFITSRPVLASTVMTLLVFLSVGGYYKPTVINTKSLRPFAMQVDKETKGKKLYAFTGFSLPGSDPMHFFGVDFYLGDRIRQFAEDKPRSGKVMVTAGNKKSLHESFAKDYDFKEAFRSGKRETVFKDTVYIYDFRKR